MGRQTPQADAFLPTRRSLLSRLKDWEDHQSWQEFFDTYWKLIYSTALKTGLTEVEAQEVVQETVISVSRSMPKFRYDPSLGSFKTWLNRLIQWRIQDQFRKRRPDAQRPLPSQDVSPRTATIERIPDPKCEDNPSNWDEDWERNLLEVAMERVKKRVEPIHYQIFDLAMFRHWPVKKIATSLKVTAAKVYLVKHRISKMIEKELKQLRKSVPE